MVPDRRVEMYRAWVDDGDPITSAGMSAGIDMPLHRSARRKCAPAHLRYSMSITARVARPQRAACFVDERVWRHQPRMRRRITQRHLAILRSRVKPSSSNRFSGPV
jgi:transcriptional regulator GlxA family with amidase domain